MIRDSRVESTRTLVEAIASCRRAQRPRVLVPRVGRRLLRLRQTVDSTTTTSPRTIRRATRFLARVCRDWEKEASPPRRYGVRVVRMRTGVVLGPGGGALAKMTTPFKLFVGGRIGSGQQWVSWIPRRRGRRLRDGADDERYSGPINLVAPESVRNAEFSRALGKALHRPSWLPVPAFALKLAVGELAEYLLEGRRVVPAALERLKFPFEHPTVATAIEAAIR